MMEEPFDFVSFAIELLVVAPRIFEIAFRRNDGHATLFPDCFASLRVSISFVHDDHGSSTELGTLQ